MSEEFTLPEFSIPLIFVPLFKHLFRECDLHSNVENGKKKDSNLKSKKQALHGEGFFTRQPLMLPPFSYQALTSWLSSQ